jgi:hypothetical protein
VLESAGAEVALRAAEDADSGLKLLQKDHELAETKFHEQVACRGVLMLALTDCGLPITRLPFASCKASMIEL